MFWLTATATFSLPTQHSTQKDRNFPEIPILEKYGGNGSAEFWKNFPSNMIPQACSDSGKCSNYDAFSSKG
jgi:hypothetical protein